jgi:hypothetical protein
MGFVQESEKQGDRYKGQVEVTDESGRAVATAPLVWSRLN